MTRNRDIRPRAKPWERYNSIVALALAANHWIRAEADSRGWRLLNTFYSGLPRGIDLRGALVTVMPDSEVVLQLRERGIPVVRLGRLPHPEDVWVPAVLPDLLAQGRMAAEHFSERGFRDVVYFGRQPWSDARLLYEGFCGRAEALGMTCHLFRSRGVSGESKAERQSRWRGEFTTWVRGIPKPVGVFASGDWQAAAQCAWVELGGMQLPDDVAVLSRGNIHSICETNMPTISSLDPDQEGQVHAACDLLDRMMSGEAAPAESIMVPPKEVVARASTDLLATPDRTVAVALRYMWEHLDLDLSVEDVAGEVGLSSRQLARRFCNALGRTITEEMLRKRLLEAKHLLRSTELSIADLAPMVGFHTVSYLHRTFRKAFGMTPAQYRRGRG